ncbi:MAG: ABC transporter substrate-binding protein [Candidatus Limiplasma sp.]|nr:ABC transporter substrate-binding protein [Candidatus Limiplasma sp.]
MQSIRKLTLGLILLLMLTALLGGALAETAGPVTLTDMKGREVTLSAPATRIVALSPADCEILYAIGAGATLVGRGEYCDYPAEVADVPSVQSGAETNIEQIVALQPQVVLMGTMAQTKEQTAALEAAGIQVVVSEAQDIAGVYTDIRMIGAVTGQTEAADALVTSMQNTFASIAAKAAGDGTKTVYFEVSPLQWGLWTAGSGTFMDELASMLGLRNAFADVQSWAQISEEQVLARDPDYIVTVAMYFGEGPTPVEEIRGRAGWQNLKAVRNEAILNVDTNEISRPGPRLAQAAEMLYAFIYEPETLVPAA